MSDIRDNLCVKNKKLLHKIEESIPVEFIQWDKNYWAAKLTFDKMKGIVYYPTEFSDAKAAHELLHIKIGSVMGDNEKLFEKAQNYPNLKYIFQHKVAEHFLNSYEHKKMFAEYKLMGFKEDDFFESKEHAEEQKSTKEIIESISLQGISTNGIYNISSLTQYIFAIISLLAYPLKKSWHRELKVLKDTNNQLFGIVKKYWDKIVSLPLTKEGKTRIDKEHEVFINDMIKWIIDKQITY